MPVQNGLKDLSANERTFAALAALARKALLGSAAATALIFSGTSGALAQNCGTLPLATGFNFLSVAASGLSATNAIQSSIVAANTAFLTQSTAFVGAPANPQPGQEGGGVWVRGVGGQLDLKTTTTVNATGTAPAFPGGTQTGSTTCNTKFSETFSGFQVGQDLAKLNLYDGWNLHIGTTAGALEANGSIVGGSPTGGLTVGVSGGNLAQVPFNTTSQSPFVGTYFAATKGSFFIDGMFRYDYYDNVLNSPTSDIFGQRLDAHGISLSGSLGYRYQLPNSQYFVEPSAGFIWSRTSVDPLNVVSRADVTTQGTNFSGTAQINEIISDIGRIGLRFGTTVEVNNLVLEPFVAASVWHDFAGNITASYSSCASCFFFGGPGTFTSNMSSTNVGTFGQYSVGVSGAVPHTGWLGFVRLDVRDGDHLESVSGTGGIRYQFNPEGVAPAMPVKAPVYKAPPTAPVVWTGWYVGAIGGANFGQSDMTNPAFFSVGMDPSGVFGGGTLGYNYQFGKFVVGAEGDGAWTNFTGSAACGPLTSGVGNVAFFQTTCHDDVHWIATLGPRLGYTWTPRTLLYVKGGAAWENETFSVSCNLGPVNGISNGGGFQNCGGATPGTLLNAASANDTRLGGMVGYGAEFAFDSHWSAKGEFDWMDFGKRSLTMSDGTPISTRQTIAEGKIGVNYRFSMP